MQLINLIYKDLSFDDVYLQQFLCEPTDWPEDALKDAVKTFMQTEGRPYVLSEGDFTWGEVRSEINDEFWKSHGFTPVDRGVTATITDIRDITVDELEGVDAALLQELQEQAEQAIAETNRMAIQKTEILVNKLETAGYTNEQAEIVVGLLQGEVDPTTVADVEDWARQCYTTPSHDELLAQALNSILNMHGVFEMNSPACGGDPDLTYLEAGDTYNLTLVKYEGDWYCASLGDVVESVESGRAIPGKVALESPAPEIDLDIKQSGIAPSVA